MVYFTKLYSHDMEFHSIEEKALDWRWILAFWDKAFALFQALPLLPIRWGLYYFISCIKDQMKWCKLYRSKNIKRSPLDSECQEGSHQVLTAIVFSWVSAGSYIGWPNRWDSSVCVSCPGAKQSSATVSEIMEGK